MDGMKSAFVAVGIILLVVMMAVAGCAVAKGRDKSNYLTLFAYNYTDRYILDITVDGMWMGGADAYTNGGSAMGPKPPRDLSKRHNVTVKWRVSGLYDMKSDQYKRMPVVERSEVISLKYPYPPDPNMLLLHFYPDGHVEAELVGKQQNHWEMRRLPIPEGHKDHGRN